MDDWQKWFAWYSVRLPDGSVVWLKYVMRKEVFTGFALDCADHGGYQWEYKECVKIQHKQK